MDELLVQPCEFRKAVFFHPTQRGYWVRLYCFCTYLDGNFQTHTFLHQPEYLENMCLCSELGMPVSCHSYEILVTDKNSWREIFQQIEDYVSKSNLNKEC